MDQRNYGLIEPERMRTLSGMEMIQGMAAGRYPGPPIAATLKFGIVEVEPGRVVFAGTPALEHFNPFGSVHGGYITTLLDSAMACAVHTTVPAGQGSTTLELKVNFVRAVNLKSGEVRAEGQVIAAGKRVATAEGRLYDASGKLCAHATTTCLIFSI